MTGYWKPDRQGFAGCWMVSGPEETPFESGLRDTQQIRYEVRLRGQIARHEAVEEAAMPPALGSLSRLGLPWRVNDDPGCGFVDCSAFYSLMRRVRFDAAVCIVAPREMRVRAALWSYAAVDLYLNGERLGGIDTPVYKPISRREMSLPLRMGRNLVYLSCCNLGVRDTRSTVALQLLDSLDVLTFDLPDEGCAGAVYDAQRFLLDTRLSDTALVFPRKAPAGVSLTCGRPGPDGGMDSAPTVPVPAGSAAYALPEGWPVVRMTVEAPSFTLSRTLERTGQLRPQYGNPALSPEDNLTEILRRIAAVRTCPRGEGIHFPMANMLARRAVGETLWEDRALYAYTLGLIDKRVDCSDFMMCGLIRHIRRYGVAQGLEEETRRVIVNYRYWMDMDGFDGMCFWSENHALMFYSSAMLAGEMYPDALFPRAGKTGRELSAMGRDLVEQWLSDVEEHGFEEFLSAVYMCVTFAVLLSVIDFGPAALAERAAKVTDRMLGMLALHTFRDGLIAPMGRVYRGVLYPFSSGAMALVNMLDPARPYSYGEGWLGYLAGSGYRLPQGLKRLMDEPVETSYTTGNARVFLEKNADYCLTSVASPRQDTGFRRWQNQTLLPDAETRTHEYTKSFNERFHGTTCFAPGTWGYQQHMWYAALDGAAVVFVNHPGSMSERGDLRPGYWHGNGVMPALCQTHGMLGAVYHIPQEHPLHYTHLYCPVCRFDEMRQEDGWLALRRGTGYLAIWCSVGLEPHDGGMNPGCEWRAYGDDMAWLVVCGGREWADMASFLRFARSVQPTFRDRTLRAGDMTVAWQPSDDQTQYL